MKIRKVLNYCICGKYWVWSKIFEKRKLSNGKNGHIFLLVIKLKQLQHVIYYIFWRNIIIAYSDYVSTHVGEFIFIFSSLKWTSGLSLYFIFYHICFWSLFQGVWRWFSARGPKFGSKASAFKSWTWLCAHVTLAYGWCGESGLRDLGRSAELAGKTN